MKRALITGITGQDGSYLAELLLAKGYEVHGVIRRSSTFNTSRIEHLYKDPHEADNCFHLHYGDITDGVGISNLVRELEPHEIYNLAAQSHVKVSFEMPDYTAQVDGVGTIRLLEAIRAAKIDTKFYVRTLWKYTTTTIRDFFICASESICRCKIVFILGCPQLS